MLRRTYKIKYAGVSGEYTVTETQVKAFFTLERRYVDSKSTEQLLLLALLERVCLDGLVSQEQAEARNA